MLGRREPKHAMTGLRRALIVGAATVFVAASSSLAGSVQTVARAPAVVYGQAAVRSSDAGARAMDNRNRTGVLRGARSNPLGTALNGHAGPVSSVAFSSHGDTLATATENGTVQLWDVRSGTLLGTLKGLSGIVDSVAFSPNGRTLAAGGRDGASFCGTCRAVDSWGRR